MQTPVRPSIQLLTRADDAGLTVGTNLAIAAACAAGAVRNVGFLAVGPALEHAVEVLRDMPGVAFGLHFTLTCEWDAPLWEPVAAVERVPSLVDGRGGFPVGTDVLFAQKPDLSEVVIEAEAQLARLRGYGLRLTYLDDHMACSWLPGVKSALHALATREGLIFGPTEYRGLPKAEPAAPGAVPRPSVRGAATGVYLHVTHPSRDDEEFRSFRASRLSVVETARDRAAESRLWSSPGFVEKLCADGVEPVRYDEVFSVGDRLECPNW